MKTLHRTTAAVAAVLLSTSLAACSQSKNNTGPEASSATGQTTQAAEQTSTQAASTQAASTPAQTPAGYQSISAPTTSISFAVPEDWVTLTQDDLQDDYVINIFANALNTDPDSVRERFSSVDLMSISPDGTNGFAENVTVSPTTGATSLPTEEMMSQNIEQQGGAAGTYSTRQTSLGDAATLTYTLSAVQGIEIAVESSNGEWGLISVSTTDASRTQELADTILQTVH
ncbi:hypothetical protein [Actinomyces sp. oral taxon 448]|uniref:hypothetical protein n=1 Tax=Actinomyces sp. oral taxon 448 TaxID=712124 RepID=UPI000308E0B0|nr:hypothetical protein [Actinomyces sp. oral taxon 448]